MRASGLSVVGWLVVAAVAAAAEAPRPFRIVATEFPPYEYTDERGRPAGIDVEIIGRVFARLGVPWDLRFYPWSRAWLMVEKGEADGVLSISYHDTREPHLLFTADQRDSARGTRVPRDYLWLSEYAFFVDRRRAQGLRFESYAQLKADGCTVALVSGYTYEPALRESGVATVSFPEPEGCFRAVLAGKADLFLFPRDVGEFLADRCGLGGRFAILSPRAFSKAYFLGFARGSGYPDIAGLGARFRDELSLLRESGACDEIAARHLGRHARRPLRPLLFVCEEWRPFEYVEDGSVRGLDADVVDAVMTRLRIPYQIRCYPWARAWMMVTNGKADAVLSVSYNAEREELLYYTDEQRAFAAAGTLPPDYLWLSEYVFFAKKNRLGSLAFESCEHLVRDGLRVGLNKGYTYAPGFPVPGLQTVTVSDTRAGFMALVEDRIDLYPMDRTVGAAELRALGLADSLVALPKPLFTKPYLAPFVRRSDYPGLEAVMVAFNRELRALRASGEYERLRERYLQPPAAAPAP